MGGDGDRPVDFLNLFLTYICSRCSLPNFPNRKKRRAKDGRFNSNRKGVNIVTVLGKTFKQILQIVDGKYIYHYKPINQK